MYAILLLHVAAAAFPHEEPAATFAPPVRLLAAGQPVNFIEEMLYPSPVLYDLDHDGRRELVCGDLWGYLRVYEDVGEADDVEWGAPQFLQVDGAPLKVPNW